MEGHGRGAPLSDILRVGDELHIPRSIARDASKYRAAREDAERLGLPLRVVDDINPNGKDAATGADYRASTAQTTTPVTLRQFDDPIQKVRYIRRDQIQGHPIRHHQQAEADG